MNHLKLGRCVQLDAPRSSHHQQTGVIVHAHLDGDGAPVTVRVQLDGTEEHIWVHRDAVRPLQEAAA